MLRFALLTLLVVLTPLWSRVVSSATFRAETYSVELPETWDSNPQEVGATRIFYSLPELGPQACLMITAQRALELEPGDLLEAMKRAIKKEFPDASFLLEREVEQDGARWREIIYTYSGMEFLQALTVRNGYSYGFMATTLEGLFRTRLPEFRQIFATWRFK